MSLYDRLYNQEKNNNRLQSLAQALQASKSSNTNNAITAFQPVRSGEQQQGQSSLDGASNLLNNGLKLYNSLNDAGILGNNSSYGGNSAISGAINNNVFGSGESMSPISSAIDSNVMGTASNSGSISDAINSNVMGSTGGGASIGSSLPWGAIANAGKSLYNNISGHSPKEYSDTEQGVIYPLQGAANGFSLGGPWGALGGALYGLGYAFKDDLGLKDSNFLTQMLFPIGMGDGGGLKISGEPILDIL